MQKSVSGTTIPPVPFMKKIFNSFLVSNDMAVHVPVIKLLITKPNCEFSSPFP